VPRTTTKNVAGAGLPVLSEAQAARELGVSPRTLERWRADNRGPAYLRLTPKKVCYERSVLDEFRAAHRVTPTTAA
jgi:hypothetical protein